MRIISERLVLRQWSNPDRPQFAAMSTDPAVMQHLLPLRTRAEADVWIDRQIAHQAAHGFCFWAVVTAQSDAFVGTVGLRHVGYAAHFTPAVEIGWRIARAFWGLGYAPEAARAALRFGFETLDLPEIVANAGVDNDKSRRVMIKLGMSHDPADDFDHPRLTEGDKLRRQVLYRLPRDRWLSQRLLMPPATRSPAAGK